MKRIPDEAISFLLYVAAFILLAFAAFALALTAPANAESIPKDFTGALTMSCAPLRINKHDDDRILWTDITALFENWELRGLSVGHHGVSGKFYDRSEQYAPTGDIFGRAKDNTEAMWVVSLRDKKNKSHTMLSAINDDKYGSWHYTEDHFFNGSPHGNAFDEICHGANYHPAEKEPEEGEKGDHQRS